MSYRVIDPDELEWLTRPHEPGEPARHVAELSERAGFAHTRANIWRYVYGTPPESEHAELLDSAL
jgi:hypothetical protein